MGDDKCEHVNFEKSRTSLGKKISKFLGNLPSEQIFTELFRWVPLLPMLSRGLKFSSVTHYNYFLSSNVIFKQ